MYASMIVSYSAALDGFTVTRAAGSHVLVK
jgi:hypothetical protein